MIEVNPPLDWLEFFQKQAWLAALASLGWNLYNHRQGSRLRRQNASLELFKYVKEPCEVALKDLGVAASEVASIGLGGDLAKLKEDYKVWEEKRFSLVIVPLQTALDGLDASPSVTDTNWGDLFSDALDGILPSSKSVSTAATIEDAKARVGEVGQALRRLQHSVRLKFEGEIRKLSGE